MTIVIAIILIYRVQHEYSPSNREIKRLNSVNEGKVLSIIGEVFNFLVIFLFYFYLKKKKVCKGL